MATCSPQALLTAGIGFERLVSDGDAMAVLIALLYEISGSSLTTQQLVNSAAGFRYLTPEDAKAVFLQQLCNWSGGT